MRFQILKKSKTSRARLGFLETEHGVVETPCLVPVATQAVIKTLTSEEVLQTKSQILICNTFHLHLKPNEKLVGKAGGLHKFMNWKRPLMTDSGGFQVFSLGFGRDFGLTSKIQSRKNKNQKEIKAGNQLRQIKITYDGVEFRSPVNGDKLFLGPKESIKIQEALGADIIFAFDECPPPQADKNYLKKSLEKTHAWAKICRQTHSTKQALFGIVQGSRFKDLRQQSARRIDSLDFDGFGIGGEFGSKKSKMSQMLSWVTDNINERKPRHLLGIGHLEDMETVVKAGMDTFDCTVPTHYARRGIAFTSEGKLNLRQAKFLKKNEPVDTECDCSVCLNYKKNYISHLLRAGEITALRLITFHNIWHFNSKMETLRQKIKNSQI